MWRDVTTERNNTHNSLINNGEKELYCDKIYCIKNDSIAMWNTLKSFINDQTTKKMAS